MSLNGFESVHALVIDDVSFTLHRLIKTFEQIGIPHVHSAANGLAACEMIEAGKVTPNLIVADFQMPEMNGLEMLKRVRTGGVANLPHDVPFIMLTGYLELKRSIPAVRLGVDGLICKPLTPAVAKKKFLPLFSSDPARDVRDTTYYADKEIDSGGALDAEIAAQPGNEETELPTSLVTPGVILSRDLKYPNGDLLIPKGAVINQVLLNRLQEVAELSGGVHRLWIWL
ncbi:MAG: response regulator [Alphaproteobacteria bacterium]|nr:response regulator [Alphaproteobacteria bacterium]